jgi:RNA polymerase sigma factor (sigma-70 family)
VSGPEATDERALVERCLSGDEAAWAEFVARYGPAARKAASRVLVKAAGGASDADVADAEQTCMSHLVADDFAALRRFRWRCAVSTYVAVLAARAACDIVSARHTASAGSGGAADSARSRADAGTEELGRLADILPGGGGDPVAALAGAEVREMIEKVLAELPPAQALTVRLFYFEGLSPREIAAFRRVAYNSVLSDLHRGRQRLRCCIPRP